MHNVMRTRPIQSSSDPVPSAANDSPSRSLGSVHRSVLLHEAIGFLDIQKSDVVVDATLGGAGHAKEIVSKLGTKGLFVGFDLDADAIERAKEKLAGAKCRVELIEANFRTLGKALQNVALKKSPKHFLIWAGAVFSWVLDADFLF